MNIPADHLILFLSRFVEFTKVTEDKSHIPNAIKVAPQYHDKGTISPKNIIPYIAYLRILSMNGVKRQ